MPVSFAILAAASFTLCSAAPRTNCVVDGDTFWIGGQKVRIADINAPETHQAGCAAERALGDRATLRLLGLLNAGPLALELSGRSTDRYGRALRIITRNGRSLGGMLVGEGLAEPWHGRRGDWCSGTQR